MSDTPTPRTDAALLESEHVYIEIVPADFARQLERENAELRSLLSHLQDNVNLADFPDIVREHDGDVVKAITADRDWMNRVGRTTR